MGVVVSEKRYAVFDNCFKSGNEVAINVIRLKLWKLLEDFRAKASSIFNVSDNVFDGMHFAPLKKDSGFYDFLKY